MTTSENIREGVDGRGDLSSALPPDEVFDFAAALAGVDGRHDRLQRTIEFYFSEAPSLLVQLRTGLESQDALAIARAAHRLAGTLVYLCAQPALAAARRVDDAGNAGDLRGAAEGISTLEHELALLERALLPHRAAAEAWRGAVGGKRLRPATLPHVPPFPPAQPK